MAGAGLLSITGYKHWRQQHLTNQAAQLLSRGDTTNAILCLRRAIQCNPFDVEACRMFASLAEQAGSRNAIWWRHRVVELEPSRLQNRIDWAKSGLVLGDLAAAKEALHSIDEAGKKSSEYQKTVASLAWALNDY